MNIAAWALSFSILHLLKPATIHSHFFAMASSFSSLKQKEVAGSLNAQVEDFSQLQLVPLVRTDQNLRSFISMFRRSVLDGIVIRLCDQAKISVSAIGKSVINVYAMVFLFGLSLPLSSMVVQVLWRVGAQPFHLSL